MASVDAVHFSTSAALLIIALPCIDAYQICDVIYPNGTTSIERCNDGQVCCDNYSNTVCCDWRLSPVLTAIIVVCAIVLKICLIACCYIAIRRKRNKRQVGRVLYAPSPYYGAGPTPPPSYQYNKYGGAYPAEVGSPPPYTEK